MMRELIHQLERLGQERQRLEVLLSRQPAFLAWKQLSEMPEPADDFSRYVRARRSAEIESELFRDPLFSAHRSVLAAIDVIERLVAQQPAIAADTARRGEETFTRRVSDVSTHAAEPVQDMPGGVAGGDEGSKHVTAMTAIRSSDNALIALTDNPNSRVINRSATIHAGPPSPTVEDAVLLDADAPPDRLTRIRRIDKDLAAALIARGVRYFAQIAAFGPADVRTLSAALGLGRRISQENWIEQAALLAMKAGASPSVGLPKAPPQSLSARADDEAGEAIRVPAQHRIPNAYYAANAAAIAERHVGSVISGQVPAEIASGHGEIDAGTTRDVCDNEIPAFEALVKAAGLDAAHYLPEMVRDVALRIAASARGQGYGSTALSPPVTTQDQTLQERASAVPPSPPDDLTLVHGIDADLAARLRAAGVTRFAEIAAWGANAVEGMQALVGPDVPISRLGWIEQAAILARGGTTAHAARTTRGELAALKPRPQVPVIRDATFAAWLGAHALSHLVLAPAFAAEGVHKSEPEVELSVEPSPTLSLVPADEIAKATGTLLPPATGNIFAADLSEKDKPRQPIEIEFYEVPQDEVGSAAVAEIVLIDAHRSAMAPYAARTSADDDERAPGTESIGATVIPLHRVTEIEAEEPHKSDPDHPNDGEPLDLVDVPVFAADTALESLLAHAADTAGVAHDDGAAVALNEPGENVATISSVAFNHDAPNTAAGTPVSEAAAMLPPAPPLNIADRITAIEHDAAELIGAPRMVLDRFRQGRQLLDGQPEHARGGTALSAAQPPTTVAAEMSTIAASHADGFGEADVHIMTHKAYAAGAEQVYATPASMIDSRDYAAYRVVVEEASVEIIAARGPAVGDALPPAGDARASGDPTKAGKAAPGEMGKIRRFLRALTGA